MNEYAREYIMILVYILIGLIAGIRIASLFMGNALVPAGYYTTYDLVVKTASVFTTAVDYVYYVVMYVTTTFYSVIQPSKALILKPKNALVSLEKSWVELPYMKCIVAAFFISLILQLLSRRKPSRR
jgi:hypothetical protein